MIKEIYYERIKKELLNNESNNKNDLYIYYNIGKLLNEVVNLYNEEILDMYATKLEKEINKKYNYRALYRFRKFYIIFSNPNLISAIPKLNWSICIELLSLKDIENIIYYTNLVIQNNLTKRSLHKIIKLRKYKNNKDIM